MSSQKHRLQTAFSDTALEGTWEEAEGAEIQENNLKLEKLETGIKKRIFIFRTASRDTVGKDLPVSEWKCRV